MEIDKVLVFDIWGDYAHFRKIETTTSPLTYSVPTGTVLSGFLAAMLGWSRDSYYEQFSRENVRFGIRILKPIKKVRININLIKTDEGFYLWDIKGNPRAPTPYEFIRDPHYRIYVWLKNKEIYRELRDNLENHKTVFTPYLGISELIADFNFIGEFDNLKPKKAIEDKIHSVLRKDDFRIKIEELEEGMRWAMENIPLYMNKERIVKEYSEILFEQNGRPLTVTKGSFYEIGGDNVVFL
ncbi:MAG: type I-B CRISPR-associated protein Cas5b [Methanothermobacter sp.]|nr:type I-B CRISPR-associated protein Cas5b [Methanothermobacter sp.]